MTVMRIALLPLLITLFAQGVSGSPPAELRGALICRVPVGRGAVREALRLTGSSWVYADSSRSTVLIADCTSNTSRRILGTASSVGADSEVWSLFEAPVGVLAVEHMSGAVISIGVSGTTSEVSPLGPSAPYRRLIGIDAAGNQVYLRAGRFALGPRGREMRLWPYAESLWVERLSKGSQKAEIVAVLHGPAERYREEEVSTGGRPLRAMIVSEFRSEEQAVVALDGSVALLRLNPYRVEWVAPRGARVVGETLPFRNLLVDARQRDLAAHEGASQWGPGMKRPDTSGASGSAIPPFGVEASHMISGDAVAIELVLDVRDTNRRYDIVSRSGRLLGKLTLRRSERFVGGDAGGFAIWSPDAGRGGILSMFSWKGGVFQAR